MKRLELKNLPVTRPDATEMELSYWIQLQTTIRSPADPQSGADIDEIRKSIRILNVLDEIGQDAKVLELEDSDYEYMVARVTTSKYTFADPAIVQFVDDVMEAGKVEE